MTNKIFFTNLLSFYKMFFMFAVSNLKQIKIMKNQKEDYGVSISVETVIQSHLSDVQIEIIYNKNLAQKRVHFVKALIHASGGDLNKKFSVGYYDRFWDSICNSELNKVESI